MPVINEFPNGEFEKRMKERGLKTTKKPRKDTKKHMEDLLKRVNNGR
jgi:hypothetical protein